MEKKNRRFQPSHLYAHNIAKHRDSSNKIIETQRMWGAHIGNQKLEELVQKRKERKDEKRHRKVRNVSGSESEDESEKRGRGRSPELKRSASEEAARKKLFIKTALKKSEDGASFVKGEELVKLEPGERESRKEVKEEMAPKPEEKKVRGRGGSFRERGGDRDGDRDHDRDRDRERRERPKREDDLGMRREKSSKVVVKKRKRYAAYAILTF
jgi:hypothetical protein